MSTDDILQQLKMIEQNPFDLSFDPVETISQGLFHLDDELRLKALQLAGSFKSPEFIKPLFHLAAEETDPVIQEKALEALSQFLHEGKLYDFHLNKLPRETGRATTKRVSQTEFNVIVEFFVELTKRENYPAKIRVQTLLQLANLNHDQVTEFIDRFYYSEEPILTRGALQAISRIERGDWMEIILEELTSSHSDQRKLAAIEAAGAHRLEEAGPELVRTLENSDDSHVRLAAIEALSRSSWESATEHLKKFLDDPDPTIKQAVRAAIEAE